MTTDKPPDLRLTHKEILDIEGDAVPAFEQKKLVEMNVLHDEAAFFYRAIADAATAKAAWEMYEWFHSGWSHLGSQGTYIAMLDQLREALTAAGIERPAVS